MIKSVVAKMLVKYDVQNYCTLLRHHFFALVTIVYNITEVTSN